MKCDMNLIRDLLLEIETKADGRSDGVEIDHRDLDPYFLQEHLQLLKEAGFINAHEVPDTDEDDLTHYLPIRLTWHGHEFIGSIRDPDIWQKTDKAVTTAGSWTLGLLKDVATAYARQKIAEVTGVAL